MCVALFCVVVLGGLSGFCNNIAEEERVGCSTLIVLLRMCLFLMVPWVGLRSVIVIEALPSIHLKTGH